MTDVNRKALLRIVARLRQMVQRDRAVGELEINSIADTITEIVKEESDVQAKG